VRYIIPLSRSQQGGLALLILTIVLVVILATNPRWIIPNATISGAITGEYTEWTSHVKLDADITVDGNKTLILNNVTLHNPNHYFLRAIDNASLIIQYTQRGESTTQIRVATRDDSTVFVTHSVLQSFSASNDRGNVTINDSTINYLTCHGDLDEIRVKLVCSVIEVINLEHGQIPIIVNSTILNGNYEGECDPAICCK
jgi:hypothetical protein